MTSVNGREWRVGLCRDCSPLPLVGNEGFLDWCCDVSCHVLSDRVFRVRRYRGCVPRMSETLTFTRREKSLFTRE